MPKVFYSRTREASRSRSGRVVPRRRRRGRLGVIIAVVTAVVGVSGALVTWLTYLDPNSADPPPPQQANLQLMGFETTRYYPQNGMLPTSPPPRYPPERRASHCEEWAGWAPSVGAADTSMSTYLGAFANSTSPISIVDVRFDVFRRVPMTGNQLIQCQTGAGPAFMTTITTNLDRPSRQSPLDAGGDFSVDGLMPGTVVTIDPKKAEYLCIRFEGTEGFVYEYGITLRVVENGAERVEQLGTRDQPLRMGFTETLDEYGEQPKYRSYDWNFNMSAWERVVS